MSLEPPLGVVIHAKGREMLAVDYCYCEYGAVGLESLIDAAGRAEKRLVF